MKLAVLQTYEVVIWGENKHTPIYRIGVQAMSEDEAKTDGLNHFWTSWIPGTPRPFVHRIEVLSDVHLNPVRKQHTLFEDLADVCVGHSMDDVQGAAVNLLLTGVQRRYVKLTDAEARWDELMGRGRQALRRRYRGDTDARDAAAESEIAKRFIG